MCEVDGVKVTVHCIIQTKRQYIFQSLLAYVSLAFNADIHLNCGPYNSC